MKKTISTICFISFFVFLQACASGAKSKNMTSFLNDAKEYQTNKELAGSIEVKEVQGGKKTNPLWASDISSENFQKAVSDTLSNFGYLSTNKTGKYSLKVALIDVDKPIFGLDLKVTTRIRYTIIENQSNQKVAEKEIVASHVATFSDAALAVKRLRLANEGSAKKNILELMKFLETLEIDSIFVSSI